MVGFGVVATEVKSLNHKGTQRSTGKHKGKLSGLMPTTAVQHVKRMRGGAQSHLMRCDDGHYYVVKFRNNPQHERVLANEFLATRLAERVGLPVPSSAVAAVRRWPVEDRADWPTVVER